MSNKIKVELNGEGVRQILKSQEVKALCAQKASEVVSRCGSGFGSDTFVGANRVNAMVFADTAEAKKRNSKDNTLLKALR